MHDTIDKTCTQFIADTSVTANTQDTIARDTTDTANTCTDQKDTIYRHTGH